MRTSPAQFEVMIEFMERNGDISKPTDGPQGRLANLIKWEELRNVLNMDASGTPKIADKWKKVWSDFKNNTKRKAAKINRAACGTGGGPACKLVLTDLEQRALNLMGHQAATGLPGIEEVGLELPEVVLRPQTSPVAPPISMSASLPPPPSPTPEVYAEHEADTSYLLEHPAASGHSTPFAEVTTDVVTSPTTRHVQSPPIRRGGIRPRHSPRTSAVERRRTVRRATQRQRLDAASEHFLTSDVQWRNLARDFATESLRLRDRELQQRDRELQQRDQELQLQTQWQNLFARALDGIERYIDRRS